MTSIASSIQPRAPAMREERSARIVFVGQNRAMGDARETAGSRVGIGGDCTLEGLAKAARSWSFARYVCFGRKPKKIAVGQSVCYAPQQFRAPILRRNKWHFAARVVQTWVELRSARSAARLKEPLQQRQQEEW